MNDYLLSLILGIVEGLTEFLPVSSTAHLRLSEALAAHQPVRRLLEDVFHRDPTRRDPLSARLFLEPHHEVSLHLSRAARTEIAPPLTHPLGLTAVAFLVTAIPSFPAHQGHRQAPGKHHDHRMVAADRRNRDVGRRCHCTPRQKLLAQAQPASIRTWKMEDMSLGQAIWIGFCQIFSAVFPGTSRSMSTIAGGQLAGMSRAAALEFSFFVSIPTMAAATLYTLYKSLRGKGENPIGVAQIDAMDGSCSPSASSSRSSSPMARLRGSWDTSANAASLPSRSTESSSASWCSYLRRDSLENAASLHTALVARNKYDASNVLR